VEEVAEERHLSRPERSFSVEDLRDAGDDGLEKTGFDDSLLSADNVFLKSGRDYALFELERPGVYQGHYLFRESRGKAAIETARKFLREIFENYAEVVTGLTPVDNKAALQITTRLGFRNYGDVSTPQGLMRLSILTKKEFFS
jgi:hypothetical protein